MNSLFGLFFSLIYFVNNSILTQEENETIELRSYNKNNDR